MGIRSVLSGEEENGLTFPYLARGSSGAIYLVKNTTHAFCIKGASTVLLGYKLPYTGDIKRLETLPVGTTITLTQEK